MSNENGREPQGSHEPRHEHERQYEPPDAYAPQGPQGQPGEPDPYASYPAGPYDSSMYDYPSYDAYLGYESYTGHEAYDGQDGYDPAGVAAPDQHPPFDPGAQPNVPDPYDPLGVLNGGPAPAPQPPAGGHPEQPAQAGAPAPDSWAQPNWGGPGEYDPEATGFIQLPPEGPERSGALEERLGTPLAAPGTGQGNYTPPPIDPSASPLMPSATTDPSDAGQWTMPFAYGVPADDAPNPGAEQFVDAAVERGTAPGQPDPHRQEGWQEQQSEARPDPEVAPAAMGQGAAAALAGSHEARQRGEPAAGGMEWHQPVGPADAPEPRPAREGFVPAQTTGEPVNVQGWHGASEAIGQPGPGAGARADAAPGQQPDGSGEETSGGHGGEYPDGRREHGVPQGVPGLAGLHEQPVQGPSAPVDSAAPPHPEPEPAADAPEPGLAEEQDAGSEEATEPADASDGADGADSEHPHTSYVLRVNGIDCPVTDAWIGESLLYVLRERLGLAGAKDGCAQGECGACSVQVDGRLVNACLVPAATAAGSDVRTVEGLSTGGQPSDVQRALAESGSVQCGFCVPGMAMTVHDLLEGNHAPTELQTRQAICGNLCRCSGYRGVLDAVRTVVAGREARAARERQGPEEGTSAPGQGGDGAARIPRQGGGG